LQVTRATGSRPPSAQTVKFHKLAIVGVPQIDTHENRGGCSVTGSKRLSWLGFPSVRRFENVTAAGTMVENGVKQQTILYHRCFRSNTAYWSDDSICIARNDAVRQEWMEQGTCSRRNVLKWIAMLLLTIFSVFKVDET
jgi:hypothetical protein